MKTLNKIYLGTVMLCLISCTTTIKFPVSQIVPAAEIGAKVRQDKNKNYEIKVTAKNLASPSRLNPPKNNYVVWIETENNGTQNIGQLINKNGEKASLKAITPFRIKELFITAEDQGNITTPSSNEISRTSISDIQVTK